MTCRSDPALREKNLLLVATEGRAVNFMRCLAFADRDEWRQKQGEVQGLLGGLVGLLTLRGSFAGWGLAIDHVKACSRAGQAENALVIGVMP